MKELINEIIERLEDSIETSEDDYIDMPKYETVKINKENFNEIKKVKTQKKIMFVDGGNAEIIRASNFSLQFVRVYYNIFKDNKKIKGKKYEFFVLVRAVNKDGLVYECDFFNLNDLKINKDDFSFDSFDKSLRQGEHRVSVSKIGEIARRFLELEVCNIALNELEKDDILVMDRDLEVDVTNEEKYFNRLYENASKNGVIISGLSKTTNLLTKKGNSVNALLNSLKEGMWYYWPLVEVKDFNVYFVKLHEKARYCFRFDVSKKVGYDINEVLSLLVENSKDPVFLGYPYGLIDADRFARVGNNERVYLRTMFIAKFGKKWEKIRRYETSLDAHNVLDNIL